MVAPWCQWLRCGLVLVVVERLEDGTRRPAVSTGAALDHAVESAAHCLQLGQLLIDVAHLRLSEGPHFAPLAPFRVAQRYELLDLLQREAKVLFPLDEADQ